MDMELLESIQIENSLATLDNNHVTDQPGNIDDGERPPPQNIPKNQADRPGRDVMGHRAEMFQMTGNWSTKSPKTLRESIQIGNPITTIDTNHVTDQHGNIDDGERPPPQNIPKNEADRHGRDVMGHRAEMFQMTGNWSTKSPKPFVSLFNLRIQLQP